MFASVGSALPFRSFLYKWIPFMNLFSYPSIFRIFFIIGFLLLLSLMGPCYAADIPCASRAVDRAKQLLTFHSGADDRMTIDETVKQLPSIRNPENPAQSFQVLEAWGYIYKGRYRMRFLYFNSRATSCLLMGEEILEYARP